MVGRKVATNTYIGMCLQLVVHYTMLRLCVCSRGQLCMAGGGGQAVVGSRAAGCGSQHEQVPAGCCQAHQAGQPAALCTPPQLDSQMASSNQVCIAGHACIHIRDDLLFVFC